MGDDMSTEARAFRLWLAQRLREQDLSQADFARRLGTRPNTVSGWVTGQRRPDPASCDRIADALGLDVDEVLTAAGHRPARYVEDDPLIREAVALLRHLSPSDRADVVTYARYRRDHPRPAGK